MSGAEKVVSVTGASGYIASWVVKLLLQRGYTDKASVRDPNDKKKTEHLLALDGAKERLQLFKADLLEEGSFNSVVEGSEGVFHTASPFYHDVSDPQAELIDPALKGTLNVLRSCAKVPSIKRVVITSSMAAVAFNGKPLAPDVIIDESWFSDLAVCEKLKLWYMISKTLAEDAAWKFTKENRIDMVAINPGLVIGPLLQPTLNTSVEPVLKLINGAETFPNITYRWVDVRDVANAHILAFENASASGRYCLVGRIAHCSEVVKLLRGLFPALKIPEKCADDKPFTPIYQVSKERAQALGVKFTPLEVTLKDTVESLKEKNFF
ncbi:PREDICTED: cinnamoyl-CoA reductase [Prunus dulcis]|uniref:Bifunctional dihydroflavonol 4-reductase/flavanone 4-reductase n=1 Tax=Prunus dulcis TaxID=3755 RepID=A0A5E4FBK3_PRUDU|nr:cinnamoyl-CoA reductase 1-like isoform X1 [Prunus dulcis]VVA25192.1 PREDICTED: cinnamoyl-CoA reductase [Prunus dulcis]